MDQEKFNKRLTKHYISDANVTPWQGHAGCRCGDLENETAERFTFFLHYAAGIQYTRLLSPRGE